MYVISINQIELNNLFKKIYLSFLKNIWKSKFKSDNALKLIKKLKSKKILYFGDLLTIKFLKY